MSLSSVLTIGGSDSCGGAGIQADVKALNNFNVHGCTAITCVTSQNTLGVSNIEPLSSKSIESQIESILSDVNINVIKTGMLYSSEIIKHVSGVLAKFKKIKVIDPVMISRAGSRLITDDAIELYKDLIFPGASLLTPNIFEASLLSGVDIVDQDDIIKSAKKILAFGSGSVLIKGGGLHSLAGSDYYLDCDNREKWFHRNSIKTLNTHGSGCTLSATIAACLSKGHDLMTSIDLAKDYMQLCLSNGINIGSGSGIVSQFRDILV